jgi:hypothetical protein
MEMSRWPTHFDLCKCNDVVTVLSEKHMHARLRQLCRLKRFRVVAFAVGIHLVGIVGFRKCLAKHRLGDRGEPRGIAPGRDPYVNCFRNRLHLTFDRVGRL